MRPSTLRALLSGLLLAAYGVASAQTLQLDAPTLDGKDFSLSRLKGKVVMLFFWSTDCVPCVQRMPELRANALGWKNKAFELVTISLDRTRKPALDYLRTLKAVEGDGVVTVPLWRGDLEAAPEWVRSAKPPLTVVLDVNGRIASRFVGRVAPEAWDDVASLIP